MEPLDPRALGEVEGIAFDIDDTLTTHGRLTPEAYGALTRLAAAGLELVAVTGRPLGWTDAFASAWPVRAAVGENGAGWARREGRRLVLGYHQDEPTRREGAGRIEALRARVAERLPEVRVATDQPARRCDLAFDVGETVQLPAETVRRLLDLIEEAGMRTTVSSVHAHAVPGDWDKATGVVNALGRPGDEVAERWLFVGDSGNDAAAFAFFERTVGVANVRAHLGRLSVPPRWVTEAERGAGFVELAEAVLEARGG